MKPLKIKISAFGPYKKCIDIDFEKLGESGIFLITGDTGAGKTTIFDSISFALFGEVSGSNRPVPSVRSDFADNDTFNDVQLLAQTYLGRPLSSNDINSILYMIDGLCFDADFIEYIMDACIRDGFNSLSSIEKRAVEYAKKDINSIEEAKADKKFREGISKSIYKIFGQAPTVPVRKEIAYIAKWTDTYGFTDEIIIEACNRTMAHMHSGNLFNYTDGILTRWYTNNVKDMSDIEKLDKLHSEEMSKTFQKNIPFANAKFSKTPKAAPKKQTFDQRTYDYKDLERKLIANRDSKLKSNK